jgi:hypothetical protein
MPIIRILPDVSSLNTQEYFGTFQEFNTVKLSSGVLGECFKCLGACKKDIPVFADPGNPNDKYTNDFTSFIFDVPLGGVVEAKLIRVLPNGTEVESPIIDDTYGTFYATGVVRLNTWAFILDWYKVQNVIAFGRYKINVVVKNFAANVLSDETTPCFRFLPYNCESTNRTVRITTEQKGYIENGFDYSNLSFAIPSANGLGLTLKETWPQQIRWYGDFWETSQTLLVDNIVDTSRNSQQVQRQIINNYNLRLEHIGANVSDRFFNDNMLANEIFIDDYQTNAVKRYENVQVSPLEIADRKRFKGSQNEIFEVTFEQYQKATLKRN